MLRDAASVILVRDDAAEGLQVYLCRRHRQARFAAGAWVFPGGRHDDEDADPGWAERVEWPESGTEPRSLCLTATRELFEEAGVLLAALRDGAPLPLGDAAFTDALRQVRVGLQDREGSLLELARSLDLHLKADELVPFAHWITPKLEPRRFDTRFFLARTPSDQHPIDDGREVFEGRWSSPAGYLEEHRRGELFLYPPTYWLLEDLAGFGTAAEALAAARERPVEPVMPRIQPREDGAVYFLLPGDVAYQDLKRLDDPTARPCCRVVLEQGRLRSIRPAMP